MNGRIPTDLLAQRAEATPERPAMVDADTGERWTVCELDRATERLASRLDRAGVEADDRVGVLLPTRPTYVRLVHAVARRGGTLVPLHARKPVSELRGPVERAGVDAIVCGESTAGTAESLSDAVGTVVSVDSSSAVDRLPPAPDAGGVSPVSRPDDDLAVIMFTSGTTGQPKGVRLTRGNLRASAEASAYRLGVGPGDRWLCCLPTYHMGGLAPIYRTALYGTTLVVQRAFDAEETAAVLADRSITGVSLVPTMLRRLLEAGWQPPESLRTVLLGGAAAPEPLLERCRERGVPVYPTYGATEAASQIATALPEQVLKHPGTVGQPLLGTRVRIVDDGEVVGRGERGEIVVDGPTVTPGYLDADRTASAFGDHGFHTGDRGYRDDDGRLWVLGRLDDRIVTGGENVDPETVAAAIREHPAVEDAAVVGLPDEEWGQRVAALVVGSVEEAALLAHCRDRLADFEVPKTVGFATQLPRTPSGTVDREAVREQLLV